MMRLAYKLCITITITLALGSCGDAGSDAGGNVGFGGAQDIGQFRLILDEGGVPGESTLDANGFFNEHFVELPAPDCGQVLCPHGMLSVSRDWVDGAYQATLQISMNTPIDQSELPVLPLNLVVVVDTSGSMNEGNRIGFVKQGLDLLIDELGEDDRMALVSYSSGVTTHADLASAPGSPLDRAALHEIVAGLNADGGTNFHDGLQAGFELSLSAYDPARQNRVIMLSDGLPTVGILDDQAIITMAEDYIGSGIGLTTVGVGLDFNVELMRGLAERGAGNFYFLEDPSAVQEVFTQELDYAVTPLALGVAIDVEASPNYQLGQVTGTRLWKTTGDTGSMFLPAVFLASRESNDPGGEGRRGGGSALFIDLLPVPGTDGPDVATIHLRFRLPDSDEIIEQTIVVENPAAPGAVGDAPYYSHEAMAKQYAMYNMFLGLREATRSADYSYDCAIAQLTDVTREAELWNRDFADEDITADRALVAQFLANLRNSGGRSEAELGYDPCAGGPYYDDDYYAACQVAPGASGAGGAAMVAMMGLALLWVRRRSRRA